MIRKLLLTFSTITLVYNFTYSQKQENFTVKLEQMLIAYNQTSSFTKSKNDLDIKADYCIENENKELKILYSLIPSHNSKIKIDELYRSITFQTIVKLNKENLHSSNKDLLTEFNSSSVSNEFNADWGATSSFVLNTNKKVDHYNFCIILALFKEGKGLVISYFLFNDEEKGLKLVEENFHNLIFKKQH